MSRALAMLDEALAAIREQAAQVVADLSADPVAVLETLEHEDELARMSDADFAAACGDSIFEACGVRSRECCGHACERDQDADERTDDLPDDEPESSAGDPAAAVSAAVERGVEAAPRRGVRGGRKHRRGGPDALPGSIGARAESPCHACGLEARLLRAGLKPAPGATG